MSRDTDAAFHALGDSTRRVILEWLDEETSATATQLAERMMISRQAVTKHLKELEAAGLAVSSKHGRENRYATTEGGLDPVTRWLDQRATAWEARLHRLRDTATKHQGKS
jgi:DNA-binding transcriptional ArsR family regulator